MSSCSSSSNINSSTTNVNLNSIGSRILATIPITSSDYTVEAGIEAGMIENPRVIGELLRFFDASPDLYITADHVVMAMRETMGFTGTVSHFPGARA